MSNLQGWLEELTNAVNAWLALPAPKDADPEVALQGTEDLARSMMDVMQRRKGGGEKKEEKPKQTRKRRRRSAPVPDQSAGHQ